VSEPRNRLTRRGALTVLTAGMTGVAAGLSGCASTIYGPASGGRLPDGGSAGTTAPTDKGLLATGRGLLGNGDDEGGIDTPVGPLHVTGPAWTPSRPLPAAVAPGQRVSIVLSPHPDDETLSLGVWTANTISRGERVIVVCLTDGRGTGAEKTVAARLGRTLSKDQIGTARIGELRRAAAALGVAANDVYLAHLDGDATVGGSRLTQVEAYAVIREFAQRFPTATYATMSYIAERHPDHLGAGRALLQAVKDGTVSSAVFAVSRLWWRLPSPPVTVVRPVTSAVRGRVFAAGGAYGVWDPARQRYAIGWTSVHRQFLDLISTPADHIHSWRA
jgi:LmbE family N-acetylglucosaminyl deacetylase